ncbi:right-handed parallel beta-helix repeat-containing protein, partial [candidate division KSB1 bacterium]|nr:right-handed parallel beta-helix repeat-containing protein [candidate division KSB1 bacterium]
MDVYFFLKLFFADGTCLLTGNRLIDGELSILQILMSANYGKTWLPYIPVMYNTWVNNAIFIDQTIFAAVCQDEKINGEMTPVGKIAKTNLPKIPSLKKITVTPKSANLSVGDKQEFTANGSNQEDKPMPIENPTWATTGGGTIDPNGNKCTYTAAESGEYTLTCREEGTEIEGVAEITTTGPPNVGRIAVKVKPANKAGTATPETAQGKIGDPVAVKAEPKPGWIFSHWINATPAGNPEAVAILSDPTTQVEAWFKPFLTLSEGPENPGYTQICPPKSPEEHTNTPIIQIVLTASAADNWLLTGVTFNMEGSGGATDVRKAKLRLNDATGVEPDSTDFSPVINLKIPPPYNQLTAGESITLMMTFDFAYQEKPCEQDVKDFVAWTNRDNINAKSENYALYAILPNIPPAPLKTVKGGPAVVACVVNINSQRAYNAIQPAIDDAFTMDGHTIEVCPGIYSENVSVTKELTIRSRASYKETIVQSLMPLTPVFHLKKNNITVEGFTIQNATFLQAGIFIFGSTLKDCIIRNNFIKNNYIGIFVKDGEANLIYDNTISGNTESVSR